MPLMCHEIGRGKEKLQMVSLEPGRDADWRYPGSRAAHGKGQLDVGEMASARSVGVDPGHLHARTPFVCRRNALSPCSKLLLAVVANSDMSPPVPDANTRYCDVPLGRAAGALK